MPQGTRMEGWRQVQVTSSVNNAWQYLDPSWAPDTRGFDSIQCPSLDHLITMPIVGHVAVYVDDLLLCGLRLEQMH
eukprot:1215461-Amphidinium_carterae.3